MIENNNEISKDLEKALRVLKQAQQRVANEKKSRTKRNAKSVHAPHYSIGRM